MKKTRKFSVISCLLVFMLLCVTKEVKAFTRIDDSQIYYVNATLTKFNQEEYNAMIRGMSGSQYWNLTYEQRKAVDDQYMLFGGTGVPGVSTACIYNPPNQNAGALTQGLASEYLVNNNLWISRFNNGATFFPTQDIVNANPGVYGEILRNWKFPFRRNSNGYYSFDSNEIVVQRNYNTQRLEPYTGDHYCFYPFSDLGADCSDVYQRAYYYSMRIDLTYTMTDDGKVNGEDMVFNFSGDDDVWIYIDGRLAVDLGGCHPISTGNLNLAANTAYYGDSNNFSAKTVYNVLNDSQRAPGKHTMTIFYMDRADGASNLVASFNLQSGGVRVNHVDKVTGQVLKTETKTTTYGGTLTTSAQNIAGYTLVQRPATETYTVHDDLETVTYYYAKNSQVNVKYLDVNTGNQLFDPVVIKGYEGQSYTTEQKNLNGYYLSRIQGNATGTISSTATDVIYYYDLVRVNINLSKLLQATNSTAVQKLAGAKFKAEAISFADKISIANPSTVYYSTVTDANGNCQITGLPYGTYKITEVTIPANAFGGNFMVGNSQTIVNSFNVEITQNQTYSYSLTDIAKKMQIKIYKEDKETGTTLQGDATLVGAQYTIYRDKNCTNAVETLTIQKQADGKYYAESGWYLVGTYYVKETKAPTGYLLDSTIYEVHQSASAQTTEKTIHTITSKDQVIKNDIEITKYLEATDSTNKQKLAGAIFSATLKSDTSKVYYSTTTDANGNCKIVNLPYGTYTLRETTIPALAYKGEFYIGESTTRQTTFEQFIQVDKSSNQIYKYSNITDVAKKIQIKIYKEDKETGTTPQGDAHLEGAQYTIYRDKNCTDVVEILTIAKNADGTYSATSGWYLSGTYYVKETKAPEGYLIDPTIYTVAQDPAQQTLEKILLTLNLEEQVIKNDIEITKKLDKTDSTEKQNLAGAVFSATLKSDTSKVYYSTPTDANGNCKIVNLPYGTYILRESTIPATAYNGEFYIGESTTRKTTFEQFVQVDKNSNPTYKYELTDVPKKMQIKIFKEDIETGTTTQGDARLEGAEYTLYRNENCTDPIETITIAKNIDGTYSATSGWYLVGTYYVKETKAPEGYLIDKTIYKISQEPVRQTSEYTTHSITSKDTVMRNHIEITKKLDKTDSTEKQNLAGAVFSATLKSDTSKVYYSTSTDANGNCIITDLPYGTYTVRETTIPATAYNGEFYIGESTTRQTTFEQFIQVDKNSNPAYKYELTDVPEKMQITIYKEDYETGTTTQGDAHLEGAEYTLYRDKECTDAIETITIAKNADGTYSATSGWYLVGKYYAKETKAPEGYLIDERVYTISQNPETQTEEHTYHSILSRDEVIRNDIEITKYLEATDSTDKQSLAGAVFSATLNSDTSKVYYSTVTDNNGYCIITELPYGTYTLRESTIPATAYNGEFYIGDSTTRVTSFEQFIEVDNSTNEPYKYTDITDVAEKMQITIYKEDIETGSITQGDAHLEGAEYTLYRDENCTDPIETITIQKQADGRYSAKSGWYLVGKYWIKETKAPEGYLIDEEVYLVEQIPEEQTEEHSSHSITSKDRVMKGIVKVIKYNNNSTSTDKLPAVGAVLRLTLNSDTSVYYEATIDENGYCEFIDKEDMDVYPYTIPYGKYTISEVKASNSGENIFMNKQQTEIRYQEQTERYIISEEYVRMRLTIKKVDSETGKPIPSESTYKIWDVNKQEWYQEMMYPSGEYISEFTTNKTGQLTLNRHLEAGSYVLYEVQAPYGYYLDDSMRLESRGYEFTIGVVENGDVVIYHDDEETVLPYEVIKYDNMPTKMYSYTAVIEDVPQKAIIKISDLAEQLSKIEEKESDFGNVKSPVFEEKGLVNAEFDIIASEDIYTPEGTKRYSKGQVVSHLKTDKDGIANSPEIYLGKYQIVQTKVPNGYVLNTEPINVEIGYTNQYEKVQIIYVETKNEKQQVNLEFNKEFKELEKSRFKFEEKNAIFGIYTASSIYNYKNEVVLGIDELVDVISTDENNILRNNVQLPEGSYYVKELYVSNPYGIIKDVFDFKVEYTNTLRNSIDVTVNDGKVVNIADVAILGMYKFSDLDYEKYEIDSITNINEIRELASECGVAGATYKVFNDEECTDPVITIDDTEAEFTTDENGTIYIEDMPSGIYYFKEVESPFGYELNEEVIKVEINESNFNKVIVKKIKDNLVKADLLEKRDTFTNDVIEGCVFEITDEEENVIYTGVTDERGIVEIPVIYFENEGTYYYQEIEAPDMYQVNEEKQEFVATYDEETCEWTLELIEVGNDRKTIEELVIIKLDEKTEELLKGCEFTIVLLDEEGKEYVNAEGETIYLEEKGITDENGEYVIENVPYGRYKFKETKAPEGYVINEKTAEFTIVIDEDSTETVIYEITNEAEKIEPPATGDIQVYALVGILGVSLLGIIRLVAKKE